MRAGVLSNDRIIKYLNENFINTWIPNSELGRVPSLQDPINKRRERERTTFDTSHALAQAIMRGWKKRSPADSLVISPAFEVIGRLPVNERYSAYGGAEGYLTFLKESLDGKLPGLRERPQSTNWETLVESGAVAVDGLNVVLTSEKAKHEILSVFRTPEADSQDYTVVEIDTTALKDGGVLTIDIWVGDAEVAGSFDLFAGGSELLTGEIPKNALASAPDIPPNEKRIIKYSFDRGQVFKLEATGNSGEKGSINGFLAKISVEPNQEPEPSKVSSAHSGQSAEDVMNAFVEAFKNLDSEVMRSILTGRAKETFESGFEDMPEDIRTQLSQILRQMEVLSSEYVGDEFHFRLKVPMSTPPETSVKMRKVEGIWLIYDVK